MGVIVRQSIIASILSYAGLIIGYFNWLWLFPKVLQAEEMGLFRILQNYAILFVPFAQIGLNQSTLRFFPLFNSYKEKAKGYLTFFLSGTIVSYLCFLALILILKRPISGLLNESVAEHLYIVLGLTFLLALTGILEAYSRSLLKIVPPNFVKEILIRLFSAVAVLFYFLDWINLTELLFSLIINQSIGLLLLAAYLLKIKEFNLSFDFSFLDKDSFNKIIRFSLFSMAGSGGILILGTIDTIMISSMIDLSEVAIYTIAAYVAVVIELPKRAITQLSTPLISRAFENINLTEVKSLYKKASINQLIIGLLLFIGIWSSIQNLFHMMPNGSIYEAGKTVIFIVGIGKLIDMTAGINGEIIVMSKYYKYNITFITILVVFVIVANYFLIPIYGLNGAAFASALSLSIFNLIKFIFIWMKYKMQPLTINTLKTLLIGLFVLYLASLIPYQINAIVDTIIRSVFITVIYSFLIIFFKVSTEANTLFRNIIFRIFKR